MPTKVFVRVQDERINLANIVIYRPNNIEKPVMPNPAIEATEAEELPVEPEIQYLITFFLKDVGRFDVIYPNIEERDKAITDLDYTLSKQ